MHDLLKDGAKFRIFGDSISATDIIQGALGNCYALAAFSAITKISEDIIRDVFVTKVTI